MFHLREQYIYSTDKLKFFTGSSKSSVTVIAEARHVSPNSQTRHERDPLVVEQISRNTSKCNEDHSSDSRNHLCTEQAIDQAKSSNFSVKHSSEASQSGFLSMVESYSTDMSEETIRDGRTYPPFPCPFCDRAYTSWGFRRRHIKAVHTISPALNCKWCLQVSKLGIFRACCRIKLNYTADRCFFSLVARMTFCTYNLSDSPYARCMETARDIGT